MSADKNELSPHEKENLDRVRAFFSSLDKLIRGIQLYEGSGPLVDRLLNDAVKRAESGILDEVVLKVTPVGPVLYGEPLLDTGTNVPKYLFQLYCDGVRELTFRPGLESGELLGLAEVFNFTGNAQDDMVTVLWKRDFKNIRYYAVDTLGMQVDESDVRLTQSGEQITSTEDGEEMQMSSTDMRLLKSQNSLNWVRRCSAPGQATGAVAEVAQQICESAKFHRDYGRFIAMALRVGETTDTRPLLLNMAGAQIAQGNSEAMLQMLFSTAEMAGQNISAAAELVEAVLSAENLEGMARLVEERPDDYLSAIEQVVGIEGYQADALLVLLKALPVGEARERLQEILSSTDLDLTPFYLDSLKDDDPKIICSTLEALGRIGSDQAVSAIADVLLHHLTEVRLAALRAMNEKYTEKARRSLVKALKDPDRDIRLGALSILRNSGDRFVGSSLLGVMRTPEFHGKDEEEQSQLFMALSCFPSPPTIEYLNQILNEKNITRSGKVIQQQKLAIEALGKMASPDSLAALESVSKKWFLPGPVKDAAKEALKGWHSAKQNLMDLESLKDELRGKGT